MSCRVGSWKRGWVGAGATAWEEASNGSSEDNDGDGACKRLPWVGAKKAEASGDEADIERKWVWTGEELEEDEVDAASPVIESPSRECELEMGGNVESDSGLMEELASVDGCP